MAAYAFSRYALAAGVMGLVFIVPQPLFWGVRAIAGGLAYCAISMLLNDAVLRSIL
jgi:hypothetical protein